MPRFSERSLSKLSVCHMDLQRIFFEVIKHIDCKILEGFRNEPEQNKAYETGKSQLKFPHSLHNKIPSMAVDVAPWPVPDWSNLVDFVYFGGFVMATAVQLKEQGKITHSIRYGADWSRDNRISDERFTDAVHFEIIT